jgi:hypothetical protein
MNTTKRPLAALLIALGTTVGCDGQDDPPPTPVASEARCQMPRPVACTDEATAALRLHQEANPNPVISAALGGGVFESRLDASGGGIAPTQSFLYVRFTPDGLQKVALGDEEAFASMEWDLAFRRYIIRSNGGASGPSCAEAALSDRPFESLTAVPASLGYESDKFLAPPTCALTPDGSPLGGPLTAIYDYYSYEACLAMTGRAFVLRLGDGRNVALEILGYYPDAVQTFCNENNRLPGGPSGAGQFRLRWKFLPAG